MTEPAIDDRTADLGALVEHCIARYATDGMAAVDELCARFPSFAHVLRRRIAILQRTGLLATAAPSGAYPARLGDFRLLELLGEGGMGAVFRAQQLSLGRQVALKVIRAEHAWSPRARERFRREIEAIAALRSPGTVQIYTVGEENGTPYYAMELVDGIDLGDLLVELRRVPPERLSAADARAALARVVPPSTQSTAASEADEVFSGTYVQMCCRIALRLARTLAHAHERGLVHRDVKPGNVMIDRLGRVLLLDFGLARAAATEADGLTRTGAVVGSLAYMAPEQMRGETDIDVRADVYGVGVTLYELLTHRAAFRADTQEDLRAKVLAGSPPPPSQLNPALPRDAETICLRAMAPEKNRRYASAAELADDLQRFLELRPIRARRSGIAYRIRRWTQRHPARATALVAIALAATGGPLALAVQERRSRTRIEEALAVAQRHQRAYEATLIAAVQGMAGTTMRLAQDEQLASGRLDGLRRELLEGAAAFWQTMAAVEEPHPRVRDALFRARRMLAAVRRELGDVAGSRAVLAEAAAELERARPAARPEEVPGIDHDLAQVLHDEAELLGLLRSWPEAIAAWSRSAEIAEASEPTAPNPAAARRHVLRCRLGMAQALAQSGAKREAIEQCREAITMLGALQPEETGLLLSARTLFATILMHAGEYDQALPELQAMIAKRTERAEVAPDDVGNLRELKAAHHNLGHLHQLRGDIPAARRHLEHGAALARRLVASFPDRIDGRISLVSSLMVLGNVCMRVPDDPAAEAACREAVTLAEELAAAHPDLPDVLSLSAEARSTLAQFLMADPEQCAEAARLLRAAAEQLAALAARPGATAQALAHLGTTQALLASALSLAEDRSGTIAAEEDAFTALLGAAARDPANPVIRGNAARVFASAMLRSLRADDDHRLRALVRRAGDVPAIDAEMWQALKVLPADQLARLQRLRAARDG